jgi:uncharacterized membrane protein YoaK (UPF0700 family)
MKINTIAFSAIMLSFVAGYSDTSTFVGAGGLFSAHVTGNFVVFAYDIVTGQMSASWIKLISVPVFILAVTVSTLLVGYLNIYKKGRPTLLIMESLLLITAGAMTYFYRDEKMGIIREVIVPMLIVFALGLQNAYGRLSVKEMSAPTTVMTGNVTQLFIDITNYLRFNGQNRHDIAIRITKGMYVIFSFLAGCIGGGVITKSIGLCSILFAGILILFVSFLKEEAEPHRTLL